MSDDFLILDVAIESHACRAMLPFSYQLENEPDYHDRLDHDFERLAELEVDTIHLDLSQVGHAGSRFIESVVRLNSKLEKRGVPLHVKASAYLLGTFRLLHFQRLFEIEAL